MTKVWAKTQQVFDAYIREKDERPSLMLYHIADIDIKKIIGLGQFALDDHELLSLLAHFWIL